MTMLDEIIARKHLEVALRKAQSPVPSMRLDPGGQSHFPEAIRVPGLSVIAEFKRRSPSQGWIARDADVRRVAESYRDGGASALSVLTDEAFFGARPEDVSAGRAAAGLSVLRKDFIVDTYQLHESRAMGADAVLLIAGALSDRTLVDLLRLSETMGLAALVEVHSEDEVRRAVDAGAGIIGVNNRDLSTFAVDPELCLRLRPLIPGNCLTVAESGVRDGDQAQRIREAGFDAVLVGEALMESDDPAALIAELRGNGAVGHAVTVTRAGEVSKP